MKVFLWQSSLRKASHYDVVCTCCSLQASYHLDFFLIELSCSGALALAASYLASVDLSKLSLVNQHLKPLQKTKIPGWPNTIWLKAIKDRWPNTRDPKRLPEMGRYGWWLLRCSRGQLADGKLHHVPRLAAIPLRSSFWILLAKQGLSKGKEILC